MFVMLIIFDAKVGVAPLQSVGVHVQISQIMSGVKVKCDKQVGLHLLYDTEGPLGLSPKHAQARPTLVSPMFATTCLGLPYHGSKGFALCRFVKWLHAFD